MSFGLPQQPFCEDSLFYPSSLAPLLVLLAILLLPPLLLHISSSSVGILVQGFPWAMLTTLDWPDCSAELAALDLPDCKALRLAEGRTLITIIIIIILTITIIMIIFHRSTFIFHLAVRT